MTQEKYSEEYIQFVGTDDFKKYRSEVIIIIQSHPLSSV